MTLAFCGNTKVTILGTATCQVSPSTPQPKQHRLGVRTLATWPQSHTITAPPQSWELCCGRKSSSPRDRKIQPQPLLPSSVTNCLAMSSTRTQSANLSAASEHSESWALPEDPVDQPVEGTWHSQHGVCLPRSSPAQGIASELSDGLQRPPLTRVSFHLAVCVRTHTHTYTIRQGILFASAPTPQSGCHGVLL